MPCVLDDFYLNYGWEHLWCNPDKNVFPKEYVKGPFLNPKLVCPLPYISLCQTDGELLKIRTGIPDCWGEYLIHQLVGDYDSMHKEDVEIAHKLRKDYRIYLGQGIPNPCGISYYPGVPNCKGLKENLRKYLLQISENRSKSRKGNCLCCEKNYLLECPDKTNTKNRSCTCKTCHFKDVELGDHCRCIEILQNWVSEDIHLKERRRNGGRKNQTKYCPCSSESSGCETDDEGTIVSSGKTCLCPKNFKMAFNSISSANSNVSCIERQSKHEEYIFGKDFLYKGFTEKKGGFGFFPYTRNIHRGNKRLRFKGTKATSKQIQTESRLIGDTKTVQTENPETQNNNKCFRCTLYQYQHHHSTCKLMPFEKTTRISPATIKNHAIICPYNCHDRKPYWIGSLEKKLKKKKREIPKETTPGDYQKHSKMEGHILKAYKITDSFKTYEESKHGNLPKINKTVGYCYQPCLRSFDNPKYLTDSRLKNYLRERETLRKFHNKTSQTLNKATKLSSVIWEEPSSCEKFDKYKFRNRKPNISGPFSAESPRKVDRYTMLPKYVDRGVMTGTEEITRKKELITKYFKDVAESDESRTYGLIRNREHNRRRRKLVRGRKRKTGGRKKENRTPKIVSKNSKVKLGERTESSQRDDKEVNNFRECKFKFMQINDKSKKLEEGNFVELFKRPSRPEQCGEVSEKISHEKIHRSPDVMKFIVGDLLIDEKSKT